MSSSPSPSTGSQRLPGEGRRLVVAMSGGVDSSAVAHLLASQGWELVGLFMRNGVHVTEAEAPAKSCCSAGDARDARMVAAQLGIPFQAVDLKEEFAAIIRHFVAEYGRGRTPNPCAMCNRDLKFNRLLRFARELGAEGVATGHYARLAVEGERVVVRRGVDAKKDQSYQLFCVAEEDLRVTHLPLGGMQKARVRALAGEAGLRTAEKRDSQEVCFIPSNDYRQLLEERGAELHPGSLVDTAGHRLGTHAGTEHFTIGQRRGHGIGGGTPLYVVDLEPSTGTVVLGTREECASAWLEVSELNLIGIDRPADGVLECAVQVRYHHAAAPARVFLDGDRARVEFERPQMAVAEGQGAAFYGGEGGDRLLGGGWIQAAERPAGERSPERSART